MAQFDEGVAVTDGLSRCGSDRVDWYLIEADEMGTIVDTGFPAHWGQLRERLNDLNYTISDIEACLLAHAHPDHIGFADRLHEEADVPIWLHDAGIDRARAGGDPPVRGFLKNIWRPAVIRYFIEVLRFDGTSIEFTSPVNTFVDEMSMTSQASHR